MTLWRVRATVDDRPGFLAVLTASLALRSVNILSVQVHATESGAVDELLVDAPDAMGSSDLIETIERGRGRDPWVARADVRGLVDEPVRALGLAARVVADPKVLPDALAALLGADKVTWVSDGNRRPVFNGNLLQLPGLDDGGLVVRRDEPAFTPAECARAQALVELARAAALAHRGSEGGT